MSNPPGRALDNPRTRLRVRNATIADIPAIAALSSRVYAGTGMYGYSEGPLTGQINNFPEGQFVAVIDEQVVGYCAYNMARNNGTVQNLRDRRHDLYSVQWRGR